MKKDKFIKEIGWVLKEKYGFARLAEFERDIQRLQKGEPVAYVIGFVDFLGCKIDLSFRPLIPRPETEFWTEKAIEDIEKSGRKKVRCLDIFAGSGCIGVAVLKHAPVAVVDFAEKEKKFLEQIKLNARLNNLSPKRRKFIQSDIFSNISGIYDYIFANPPYVAKRKNAVVQKSVLEWEPAGAAERLVLYQ
ncbi:MAG: Protoporphyrinogen oxidase [Candidatus Azambacteria bacterium GW2011_GWF2_46_32]|uniref:Protoporphyrinogen oxidase n=1 Tax=Candidatus Azambacteria bacterium GW2011_GWF2_46_32 TaxID=1618628 RepID=A0A0G1PUS2_9BACT|nr:MAG: Protoporphyrinogen oxidase [Candidatus Azambacteria bacterium GW2011_GWF2_46_32]